MVYILAEVRKLLEVTEESDNYKALTFYCSWALHTRMRREGAGRILERFDNAHALAILMPGTPNIEHLPEALRDEIGNTMNCTKFREQLEAVLQKYGLPINVTSVAYEWIRFLSLYSEVTEECPLIPAKQGVSLEHIESITVTKRRDVEGIETDNGEIIMFVNHWTMNCKNPKHTGGWDMCFTLPKKLLKPKP